MARELLKHISNYSITLGKWRRTLSLAGAIVYATAHETDLVTFEKLPRVIYIGD